MKFLIPILLCFTVQLTAQTTDTKIAKIRKEFNIASNTLKACKKINIKLDGFSTEGGEITVYETKKMGHVQAIFVNHYGETGMNSFSFYYNTDQQLIFAEHKQSTYNTHIIDKKFDVKKTKTTTSKYYFEDKKIIKKTDGKNIAQKVETDDLAILLEQEQICLDQYTKDNE